MALKCHSCLLGGHLGHLGVKRSAFAPPRLYGITKRRGPLREITRAFGSGKRNQSMIQGYVQPAAAQNRLLSSPWYIKAPLAIFGLVAVLRVLKAISNRDRGSLDTLQGRGLISEERSMANTDPFYDKVMKNVRTVQYEELSDDQIKAARMRRSRDRDFTKVDLEKVELPANHPFAMKKQVSRDEEKLQKARLEIKRGLPLQDLANNRGFPDSPRMQPQEGGRQQGAPLPSRTPTDRAQPHPGQPPPNVQDSAQ